MNNNSQTTQDKICKACGGEIKHSKAVMLAGFCSEVCYFNWEENKPAELIIPLDDEKFGFEDLLHRKGKYLISNERLDEILYGISDSSSGKGLVQPKAGKFNIFLAKNGYELKGCNLSGHKLICKK